MSRHGEALRLSNPDCSCSYASTSGAGQYGLPSRDRLLTAVVSGLSVGSRSTVKGVPGNIVTVLRHVATSQYELSTALRPGPGCRAHCSPVYFGPINRHNSRDRGPGNSGRQCHMRKSRLEGKRFRGVWCLWHSATAVLKHCLQCAVKQLVRDCNSGR